MLNNIDASVEFGNSADGGLGPDKAFPFLYNFIPSRDWNPISGVVASQDIGPRIASGDTRQFHIILDPDFNYDLQWFKYQVEVPRFVVGGTTGWYDSVVSSWEKEAFDTENCIGLPMLQYIRMSVSFRGSDNRWLYGGTNVQANTIGSVSPIPVRFLQGYDYGYGQLITPYLLPREGTLIFEITNTHNSLELMVGGYVYGMKVRI